MPLELSLSPFLAFPTSTSTHNHHSNRQKTFGFRSIFCCLRTRNKLFQSYHPSINSEFLFERTKLRIRKPKRIKYASTTSFQQQIKKTFHRSRVDDSETAHISTNDDKELTEQEKQNMETLGKFLNNPVTKTRAFNLLQNNQRIVHQLIKYSTLELSQLDKAFQLYKQFREHLVEVSFEDKKHLILKFLKNLWISESMMVLEDMCEDEIKPDIFFINKVLAYLKKSRNYQEISQLFHNIHKHGIQPDTRTYTIIIQTCVLQGDMSMALEYYEKMKALGIEPNDITYLVLIQGFSKQNDLLNVSKMYNMMLKTIKMRPAYKMLNTMVDLYMRNEEIGKAEETFKIMKNLKLQPDISLYNIIIHNSTLKLDMKTANSFFQEIIKSGFKPDIYTYNIMINGYINSGDQKSAWRMYYHMREQGIEPNEHVGSSLLQLHYEAQDYQGTEQLFNKFFHNITLSRTGNQNKLASAHDIESVNEIYKEFLQVIDKSSKGKDRLLPDSNVFNIFISKFAQGFGDLKRAEEVCKDMTSRGIRSDVATFTILIDGYAMLGQIEKAEETFRTLKSTLLIKPNAYSYTSLIKAWVWVRREDKVKEVYEEMIKEGIKPHRATLRALMKEIIGIPSAQDEISLMPKTPRHILDTLLWSDRLDKAHDVTYAHEIFKNFLRQTDNLVYLGRKPKLNPYSFTIFMRSFALQHGNMSLSLKVFEEMLQRNISPNNVSYGILIEGYARLNQPENAEKIFLEMKNRNIKPTIKNYNSLIRAWVKAGKREKFKEVYQQMIKEGIAPNEQTISIIKMLY
ncbi:4889_t:CDS:2 [Acaulospora morrowiae]|uniref:4889_t:CDS:1 n=1 Tax=Acaulospora morrowiae TaxID=94023 RepID=A0A9N9FCE8_9GLOM|nr:4889_t:CDS:2 [Acaulospora morrowiae]